MTREDRKEKIINILLVVWMVLFALAICSMIYIAGRELIACCNAPKRQYYGKSGTITAIDRQSDSVTFTDRDGNAWMFTGAEDWQIGDDLAVVMDDNGTASILDDIIVSARYEAKGE